VTWVTAALTDWCVSGAVYLFQHKEKALRGNYRRGGGGGVPWGIELYFLGLECFHCVAVLWPRSINWPYRLALGINFT
jgi:hypothetical protein